MTGEIHEFFRRAGGEKGGEGIFDLMFSIGKQKSV